MKIIKRPLPMILSCSLCWRNEALERLDELSLPEDFNEAYQASCWNDVAFIPATMKSSIK